VLIFQQLVLNIQHHGSDVKFRFLLDCGWMPR